MTRATLRSSDGRSCSDGSSTMHSRWLALSAAISEARILPHGRRRPAESFVEECIPPTTVAPRGDNLGNSRHTLHRLKHNHFRKPILDLYLALLRKLGAQNLDSCNRKTTIRGPCHRYAQGPKIAVRVLVTPASSISMTLRSIATRTSCERGRNGKRDATGTGHEGPHRDFGSMTCPIPGRHGIGSLVPAVTR